MKKIILSLCVVFIMLEICLMNGCGGAAPAIIKVTASSELSEYDVETHTEGSVLSPKKIYCGKRYKLSFNFDFTNLEEVLKKDTINVTMTVHLGQYDNEENKHLLESRQIPDGMKFTNKGNGEWQAVFTLSSDDIPDFEMGYFIVGIDSLGTGESTEMGRTEEITVEFTLGNKEALKYEFKFNGSSEYTTSLLSAKGDFVFTQEDNIINQIGINAIRNNMIVLIPAKCGEIVIDFYEDDSKTKIYGTKQFDSINNAEEFKKNEISLVISDYVKEFLGTAKYDEMLSSGDIPIYLVITAVGGNNYNDGVVEMYFSVE